MMDGMGLFRTLVEATGLPNEAVEGELNRLFEKHGLSKEQITLEQLREVLEVYLQETLLDAKNSLGA